MEEKKFVKIGEKDLDQIIGGTGAGINETYLYNINDRILFRNKIAWPVGETRPDVLEGTIIRYSGYSAISDGVTYHPYYTVRYILGSLGERDSEWVREDDIICRI